MIDYEKDVKQVLVNMLKTYPKEGTKEEQDSTIGYNLAITHVMEKMETVINFHKQTELNMQSILGSNVEGNTSKDYKTF